MKKISEEKNKQIEWGFYLCNLDDFSNDKYVRLYPNHFGRVRIISKESDKQIRADGILTEQKETLAMKTADCIPVIVYWPNNLWTGILHFGYKGLLFGLAENFAKETKKQNLNIKDANFILGPAICKKCYSHKNIIRKIKWLILKLNYPQFGRNSENYSFDLVGAVIEELLKIGVNRKKVSLVTDCTHCKLEASRHYGVRDRAILSLVKRK